MLVQIRDRKALAKLPVVNLIAYLNSRGWNNAGRWGERPAIIYTKEHGGRNWEVLVPLRDTVADYADSMAESVAILAEVEERSQLEVFHDLSATGADVIRLRSDNGMIREALSLRQSANLLNDAYDMLASAARAVEKPQAAYRGKMSSEVVEYLDNVRPLTGYSQGYALTLPLPGAGRNWATRFGGRFPCSFPRRATNKLAQALVYSSSAISEAVAGDTLEPFKQAVDYGVSANLCDSVAELAKKGRGIAIDLVWADVRPSNIPDSHFQFTPTSADILEEVAKSFRFHEPSTTSR